MKNLSRAYNRHKQETKFKRRVKNWFSNPSWNDEQEIKKALTGNGYTFLKTTSRPCNCFMCSGDNKYKRIQKNKVIRDALRE